MRFTMPSSFITRRGSCLTSGTRSATSPPPAGRAPRRTTLSSREPPADDSSRPHARRSSGRATVRQVSMEGSSASLVMPRRVMDSGCGGVVGGVGVGGWGGGGGGGGGGVGGWGGGGKW